MQKKKKEKEALLLQSTSDSLGFAEFLHCLPNLEGRKMQYDNNQL